MQDTPAAGPSKGWLKYLILGLAGFFLLICLIVGGILFFVFSQLKDSHAAKMAVAILRESPAAKQNLGEIEETGWPIGSISVEGGGSGHASFSMSVKGSRAKGKYYATLYREHGIWHYQSGRVALADGRSVEIVLPEGARPPGKLDLDQRIPTEDAGPAPSSGGQQLTQAADTSGWQEQAWPDQPIRFKVPGDWKQISLSRREVEFRPEDRSAYFVANATFFDQAIPYQGFFGSQLTKSANQLQRGEILGYSEKYLGQARGLFELQKRSDGQTTAVWTGYFDDERFGTISVTILLGAPNPEKFAQAEPVLAAILESIQIK